MTTENRATEREHGVLSTTARRLAAVVHTRIYRLTGGRVGGAIPGGATMLLLHTTGRKSGTKRTTPLVYIADGDDLVVIASYGGSPKHPAWWLNLRAQPAATVQIGRDTFRVQAEEATGEERERLWARAVAAYSGYTGYQQKTSRRIPVVVLRRFHAGRESTYERDT